MQLMASTPAISYTLLHYDFGSLFGGTIANIAPYTTSLYPLSLITTTSYSSFYPNYLDMYYLEVDSIPVGNYTMYATFNIHNSPCNMQDRYATFFSQPNVLEVKIYSTHVTYYVYNTIGTLLYSDTDFEIITSMAHLGNSLQDITTK